MPFRMPQSFRNRPSSGPRSARPRRVGPAAAVAAGTLGVSLAALALPATGPVAPGRPADGRAGGALPGPAVLTSTTVPPANAYSLLTSTGRVVGYGGAYSGAVAAPASPVVAVASTPDGHGAYAAEADGGVIALGDAVYHGSMAGTRLVSPVVGIAVDASTGGYWLVAADGGIFTFGGAHFHGSQGGKPLAQPVVGMAATSDGGGYWIVASDGGIFTFGDAHFYGSEGGTALVAPVIAMAATPTGRGYWMVAKDGGIFTFGNAPFDGSGTGLGAPIVGMAVGAPGNYGDPLRAVTGLRPERVDEGVDYGGSGPIYAIGDGIVTSIQGSWPDGTFISYELTDGPAVGHSVYVAENVTPTVSVGQTVTSSTVIGLLHDAWPDMEIGWAADPYGDTMAALAGQWTSADDSASLPTAFGTNFDQLLVSLGAPSGVFVHPTVTGTLPSGWPGW